MKNIENSITNKNKYEKQQKKKTSRQISNNQ